MRLLDLFCGQGGASMGYWRAGFDVVGVDYRPMPRYPFEFVMDDALHFLENHGREFQVIHASPPCQHFCRATAWRGNRQHHPDLLAPTKALLSDIGVPWVIENVTESPLDGTFVLCGSMFGLQVRRHRKFETSLPIFSLVPQCDHRALRPFMHKQERAYGDAMGCPWMSCAGHRQAIPPAYTFWIGKKLMEALGAQNSATTSEQSPLHGTPQGVPRD